MYGKQESYIIYCSTMRGRIKGTDSSITDGGIYRTGGEFIEPEAVWKRIQMPSTTVFRATNQLKHLRLCSIRELSNSGRGRGAAGVLYNN